MDDVPATSTLSRGPAAAGHGLLALRSWTTYELAKQVQRSLRWFWPRAERRLYDEPKRLVADGLATASVEATGRRQRTVYSITEEGRAELRRWLSEPPAERSTESEALVKLFYADQGSVEQLLATLTCMGEEAETRLTGLRALAAQPTEVLPFPERSHISALGLRFQIDQECAVVGWAAWAREQVAQWPSTSDTGEWDARTVLDDLAR